MDTLIAWTRKIPTLGYVGLVLIALAVWSDDVLGLYIGGFCLVIASLQLGRDNDEEP